LPSRNLLGRERERNIEEVDGGTLAVLAAVEECVSDSKSLFLKSGINLL